MKLLISFSAGVIFSIGLIISGMINPERVKGFLDVFGQWDPALLGVMGGAVLFNLLSFTFLLRRKPLLEKEHDLPQKKTVDRKLFLGTALFGIGWGLVGICPGPALVNLVNFSTEIMIFILAMLVGMALTKRKTC